MWLLFSFQAGPTYTLQFTFPSNTPSPKPPALLPLQPDPLLWAMFSFWEWLLLADVRWLLNKWVEVKEVVGLLAGVLESPSRLLEPLLVYAKQEWLLQRGLPIHSSIVAPVRSKIQEEVNK